MICNSRRKAIFVKQKLIKAVLFFMVFSDPIVSMEGFKKEGEQPIKETQISNLQPVNLQPMERIEFGFVLLPDESTLRVVQGLANTVSIAVKGLTSLPLNPDWGNYSNEVVRVPHVSVGQYGYLGKEYSTLKEIVTQVAGNFSPLEEPLSEALYATDENIFLDFRNINGKTNPKIIDLYRDLRHEFMTKMATKFPIAQALKARLENKDKPEELSLIDEHFQNWGTPEEDRIRPHFTLVYNYSAMASNVSDAIKDISVPPSLKTITFNSLGIAQIDTWGNPTKLLYVTNLSG